MPLLISGTGPGLALMGGVDLVLELPTVWAVSSAESFAQGAVDLLEATGVVDVLSFGSECGDVDRLQRVALCVSTVRYTRREYAVSWTRGCHSPPPGRKRCGAPWAR